MFQDYLADRGLKFDQVSVRFCAISNIFNFDIRHMTPAEIHARAASQDRDGPDSVEGGFESAEGDPDGNCVETEFNVSQVPVLDDSAISSGSSNVEFQGAADAPRDTPSESNTPRPIHSSRSIGPDGPTSNASGALLFLVRVLFLFNLFISSSFFVFLS